MRVHFEAVPAWASAPATLVHASPYYAEDGSPLVTVSRSDHGFHFCYADETRFWIASAGDAVWCAAPAHASLGDTSTYLTGPILALALRLRGVLALHASAVAVDGGAIAFAGPHRAGKSTIAAALAARGCPVVTDDLLHLRLESGRWMAEPYGGMLRLWPDAAALVFKAPCTLPPITHGWDKRALATGAAVPAVERPVALRAIAVLSTADDTAADAIAPLSASSALVQLSANSASTHLLDGALRVQEFRALAALVRTVPSVRVWRSSDTAHFDAFIDRVLGWARQVQAVDGADST